MAILSFLRIKVLVVLILAIFCYQLKAQTVIDLDGNEYSIAKLGTQQWLSSNLNVVRFRNGDSVPEAKTPEEWKNAVLSSKPAWCNFNNDPLNGMRTGRLYNWFAINDPRGLAPEGWRIAVNTDWTMLVKNLLGNDYAGPKLKSTSGWKANFGTNKIGFAAIPAGYRDEQGLFKEYNSKAQWWSNSVPIEVKPSNQIYSFILTDQSVSVSYVKVNKGMGLSVRCIKE